MESFSSHANQRHFLKWKRGVPFFFVFSLVSAGDHAIQARSRNLQYGGVGTGTVVRGI